MRIAIQGQAAVTRQGKRFVDGRTLHTLDGAESTTECAD